MVKRALFLHIHKTAGTSVQEMAREVYGNKQVVSHADFQNIGVEGCRLYEFISGHFGFAFAQPLMEGRYCFTFLRDPADRLVSLYDFCLARNPAENPMYAFAQSRDLEGFLRDSHDSGHFSWVWNNQVWQLAHGRGHTLAGGPEITLREADPVSLLSQAKLNLTKFDHVGLVQFFREDISKIFRDLEASHVTSRWSNASQGSRQRQNNSRPVRLLLDSMTELDRELYDHAIKMRNIRSHRGQWAEFAAKQWSRAFSRA